MLIKYSIQGIYMCHNFTLEAAAFIAVNLKRYPIDMKPVVDKYFMIAMSFN